MSSNSFFYSIKIFSAIFSGTNLSILCEMAIIAKTYLKSPDT